MTPPSAWAQAAGKWLTSCRCSPTSCWQWRRPVFNGGVLPHTPQEILACPLIRSVEGWATG